MLPVLSNHHYSLTTKYEGFISSLDALQMYRNDPGDLDAVGMFGISCALKSADNSLVDFYKVFVLTSCKNAI